MKLKTRLRRLAERWCAAHDRSLARLSTLVMNDGGFFERLRNPKAGVTDGTLEKFGMFFADPANWPEDRVPEEAIDFLHVLGLSALTDQSSPGSGGGISPEEHAVAGGALMPRAAEGVAAAHSATPEAAAEREVRA